MPGAQTALRRERSLSDAVSALVGLAGSPVSQKRHKSGEELPAVSLAPAARDHVGGASTDTTYTANSYANSSSGDDDPHAWSRGSPSPSYTMPPAPSYGGPHGHHMLPRAMPPATAPRPPDPASTMSDAQLLTSTAVLLASCGLVHAVNASIAPASGCDNPSGSASETSSTAGDAPEAAAPTVESDPSHLSSPLRTAVQRPAAQTPPEHKLDAATSSLAERDPERKAFLSSVWRVIRLECAHVRALERSDFARLCHLLSLPLELCALALLALFSPRPILCRLQK